MRLWRRGAAALALLAAASLQAAEPMARIARFPGDRAAALTYTFDDNLRDQYTVGLPMLNEAGFKGTFFVIPGATTETPEEAEKKKDAKRAWGSICWTELQQIAAQGHEIGSHTWSHRGLPKLTPAEVETELSKSAETIRTRIGRPALTLAFPFNSSTPEIRATALKYYVGFRSYQLGLGANSTAASLNAWAEKQVTEKSWGVLMAHAIGSGYSAMSHPEELREHFRYVRGRAEDIWVDTFGNLTRYEKERDDAKLTVTGWLGRLSCTLTGTLDPQVYDRPLTLVIEAPGAKTATAQRGAQSLPARVVKGKVQVDAAPGPQPVVVTWR